MEKVRDKKVSLEEVLKEVQALRREVALFIPSESLDEYAHPEKIVAATDDNIVISTALKINCVRPTAAMPNIFPIIN